jgi:hypothetical protein
MRWKKQKYVENERFHSLKKGIRGVEKPTWALNLYRAIAAFFFWNFLPWRFVSILRMNLELRDRRWVLLTPHYRSSTFRIELVMRFIREHADNTFPNFDPDGKKIIDYDPFVLFH